MVKTPIWLELGQPNCAGEDTSLFYGNDLDKEEVFGYQEVYKVVKKICDECEILKQCRNWALSHEYYGFWGGMSAGQRRKYRTEHNIAFVDAWNVEDWENLTNISTRKEYINTRNGSDGVSYPCCDKSIEYINNNFEDKLCYDCEERLRSFYDDLELTKYIEDAREGIL